MQASGALSDVSSRSITYPPVEVRVGSTADRWRVAAAAFRLRAQTSHIHQARARSAPIPSPSRHRRRPPESVNVCDVDLCPESAAQKPRSPSLQGPAPVSIRLSATQAVAMALGGTFWRGLNARHRAWRCLHPFRLRTNYRLVPEASNSRFACKKWPPEPS